MDSPSFAVIAEGPTDFTVIQMVLARLLDNPDITITQIQPTTDATTGLVLPGGWTEVFRCLASDRFVGAFEHADHVIIHIDTDVCEEPHFGVSRRHANGTDRTPEELLALTRERLVAAAPSVFEQFENRIIFAIAVESIECWLLPLFYKDNKREKTVNCLAILDRPGQEGQQVLSQGRQAFSQAQGCSRRIRAQSKLRIVGRPTLVTRGRLIESRVRQPASTDALTDRVALRSPRRAACNRHTASPTTRLRTSPGPDRAAPRRR